MSTQPTRCPCCGSNQLESTEGGFLESGEYDEGRNVYENERDVEGHHCVACDTTFYL